MLASQREGGRGRGRQERQVDDAPHAGRHGGIDGGDVLAHPVGRLAARHQEERLDTLEGAAHLVAGAVVGGHAHLGAGELRGPRGVAHHEALRVAALRQERGHPPSDDPGGPSDADESSHGNVLRVAVVSCLRSEPTRRVPIGPPRRAAPPLKKD